jgi:DNA-binding CsgD family transcriptional regulator
LVADWPPAETAFAQAFRDLAALEMAMTEHTPDLGALARLARRVYDSMSRGRFAYGAGVAAVALARAGQSAPSVPTWLAIESPAWALWEWAQAIDRDDAMRLRAASGRLMASALPYEAALALRDAGDLHEAYRLLRALGATSAREQVAGRLRADGRPIPRGPRLTSGCLSLTDMERAVCRLVVGGATNEAAAAALGIGPSTVRAHLTRIYEKTGRQGRTALAAWWAAQEMSQAVVPAGSPSVHHRPE